MKPAFNHMKMEKSGLFWYHKSKKGANFNYYTQRDKRERQKRKKTNIETCRCQFFHVIMEPHQTLQYHESQSIGDCLDDKIE